MALTDYTFRLGDTGVVLNDDSLSLPFVDITRVIGLDSAPYRETARDHEGTDGGFMDAEFEKGRPIILEGTAYAAPGTLETYIDSLKYDFAPSQTLVPLYLKAPGVAERVVFVKPLGVRHDWEQVRRIGGARVQFGMFAEDPRIYTNMLQDVSIPLSGLVTDGFGFPLGFPFGFGAAEQTGIVTLTNAGNRPTPVEFTMTGPAVEPRIINETTGDSMKFDIVLSGTDVLVINTYYKTVRLNGANRRNALVEPNWFDLPKGNTDIRFQVLSFNTNVFETVPLNANPFFEADVANWTAIGGTFVKSTTKFHEGAASGLLTPDGVTATVQVHSEQVPVTGGKTYKATSWLNCDVSRTVNVQIAWFDSSLVLISTSSLGVVLTANTWALAEPSFNAPINAAHAWLQFEMTGTPLVSHLLHVDESKLLKAKDPTLNAKFRSAWR